MKTIQERMRGFHDNAGELHKDVDERIRKVNRKKGKFKISLQKTKRTTHPQKQEENF